MKKKEIQLNPPYLDNEEKEIIEAFNRGEFKRVDNFEQAKKEHIETAKNTVKRQAISLRLPERDLMRIKTLARRDGVPYQTLITSIIHRYADGTLKRAD